MSNYLTNYYNCELYTEPFFTTHILDVDINKLRNSRIKYNASLLADYYRSTEDNVKYSDEIDKQKKVDELFWRDFTYYRSYRKYLEPLIFDETIALACNLIPFNYEGLELLAIGKTQLDELPRLDAYQVITHNTIDENSDIFWDLNNFEETLGDEISGRVLRILQMISY